MPTIHNTYNAATNIREDVIDIITNLSPKETQLMSGMKKGKQATNTYHEYETDTYEAVTGTSADKKAVEGADYGNDNVQNPTRHGNHTQIIKQTYSVTGTSQAVNHVGMGKNPFAHHKARALVNWKHKAEWSFIHGVSTAGTEAVAREMGGFFNLTTTNAVAATTPLTETQLADYMQLSWTNSTNTINEIYLGAFLKRVISGFTAGSTKNMDATDKRLILAVDVYETDFGVAKIFLHRFIDSVVSAANTHNLMMVAPGTLFQSWLRSVKNIDVPVTSDSKKGVYVGELTMENRYEAANVAVKGITES